MIEVINVILSLKMLGFFFLFHLRKRNVVGHLCAGKGVGFNRFLTSSDSFLNMFVLFLFVIAVLFSLCCLLMLKIN